ncbi:MAG: GNAT family N-acetyltransferase [Actinomycetales bacterium]|nr:GNAT family N-acetyltransferase [Actinomycetales bacterium]
MSLKLQHGEIVVRLVRVRDAKALEALILGHRSWLRPWEATNPSGANSFDIKRMIRGLLRQADQMQGLPMVIEFKGELVGQLNVANILYGSVSSANIGYWISPEVAGKNITPISVALVTDYLFNIVGLHRVQIDIRPENAASLRVVEKLGFRFEGTKLAYIHINGDWRDHHSFALTAPEVEGGLLNRWLHDLIAKPKYPFRGSDI